MSKYIIEGGHKLSGTITPQGAKNEALEVISAVLLTSEPVTITNIPEILDVKNLIGLLESMGVKVNRHAKGTYTFQADAVDTSYIETQEFIDKCAELAGITDYTTTNLYFSDYDLSSLAYLLGEDRSSVEDIAKLLEATKNGNIR